MECVIKNLGAFGIDEDQLKSLIYRLDAVIVDWSDIVPHDSPVPGIYQIEIDGKIVDVALDAQDIALHRDYPVHLVGLSHAIDPEKRVQSAATIATLVQHLQSQQQFSRAEHYNIWFFLESN